MHVLIAIQTLLNGGYHYVRVCNLVWHARVLEGVATSRFPLKAVVSNVETVFKDGFVAIYPLHHSGVAGVGIRDQRPPSQVQGLGILVLFLHESDKYLSFKNLAMKVATQMLRMTCVCSNFSTDPSKKENMRFRVVFDTMH